jgi:hypothetical protein
VAAWQVEFYVVPRTAITSVRGPLTPGALADGTWWAGASFPEDYDRLIGAFLPAGSSTDPDAETWGATDGNRIDVRTSGGEVRAVQVRVDVRKLDSMFGAALLIFLKAIDGVLVRRDGLVVEPTIAGYSGALRSSAAWRHASDPFAWIAAQKAQGEDV